MMDLENILRRLSDEEQNFLTALIEKDPLTGAYNRRKLDRDLELVASLSARSRNGTSLLMIDIDHFKLYNDRYGHQMGDQVLQTVTQCIKKSLREYDRTHLYRYGGEEFVVLMPGVAKTEALNIGERIRTAVGGCSGVSVSIGISHRQGKLDDLDSLIHDADRALYRAKQGGRNRVAAFRPDDKPFQEDA